MAINIFIHHFVMYHSNEWLQNSLEQFEKEFIMWNCGVESVINQIVESKEFWLGRRIVEEAVPYIWHLSKSQENNIYYIVGSQETLFYHEIIKKVFPERPAITEKEFIEIVNEYSDENLFLLLTNLPKMVFYSLPSNCPDYLQVLFLVDNWNKMFLVRKSKIKIEKVRSWRDIFNWIFVYSYIL